MKKTIIKKTIGGKIYWLRMLSDGKNEDDFIKVAEYFYKRSSEGHEIFIRCCLTEKFIAEDLDKNSNHKLYTKLQFGVSTYDNFLKKMKEIDEKEKKLENLQTSMEDNFELINDDGSETIKVYNTNKKNKEMFDAIKEKAYTDPNFKNEIFEKIHEGTNLLKLNLPKKC